MSFSITLTIPGNPVAAARGRAFGFRNKAGQITARVYDPAKSRDWKHRIAVFAVEAMRDHQMAPPDMALVMSAEFIFQRPASVSAKKRPHHITKPDLDNLAKAIKDGMKGIVYADDRQIIGYMEPIRKRYCEPGESPMTKIRIVSKGQICQGLTW